MESIVNADKLYLAFAFSVSIGQQRVAGFSEVSGLLVETEVETYREGGLNRAEHQLAGPAKYSSRLVLKRGFGDLAYFWKWYVGVVKGRIVRRDVTVVINCVNGEHEAKDAPKWVFRDACPVKWTGPELRASSSAIAFETIELVHRGVHL
jgi:phage tail-like protein